MILEQFVKEVLSEQARLKMEIPVPEDLQQIAEIFFKAGAQLYLVGGSVRDALMGKQPKDFDVATNVSPDEVIRIMSSHPEFKMKEVGKAFGVVIVVGPSGEEYEVATFRKDIGAGRRPDSVEFTTIENDVNRRDLTINALFYDMKSHEVVDYVGGIEDIKNNVVRTVGDPDQRFAEDRLRVLRAFRFAGRLGAELDPMTAKAIEADNSLAGVSPERIRDEFLKGVLSAKSVITFMEMLLEFQMFDQIFPRLDINDDFVETKNFPVLLARLLMFNEESVLATRLNSLKYTAEEVSQVVFLREFSRAVPSTPIVRLKKSFAASHLTAEDLLEFCGMSGPRKTEFAKKFLSFRLSVSPIELMAQGFKGKELGEEIARQEQALWSAHI